MARLFARLIAWLLFRSPVEVIAGQTRLIFDPRSGRLFPCVEGAAGDDDDSDDDEDDSDDEESDDDSEDDEDESDHEDDSDDDDSDDDDEQEKPSLLKRMSRRHERRAKAEKKRADRLQAEIDKLKAGGKGDDDADKDARDAEIKEKEEQLDEERRSFRLEQAVERIARGKGLKVEIDGKEKTVKFTDPDDALAQIERQIAKGDLDASELYDDDGRVNRDALKDALVELAEDKPHLVGAAGNGNRPKGKGDGGKGDGGKKPIEEMTADEHFQRIRRHK